MVRSRLAESGSGRCAFPTAFAGGPNLFGQGAELQVERFEVVSADVRRR
jgi:hypothetical protein